MARSPLVLVATGALAAGLLGGTAMLVTEAAGPGSVERANDSPVDDNAHPTPTPTPTATAVPTPSAGPSDDAGGAGAGY